jgi:1-acyl-sn-glycerol-3-phosphate acyltransferase
MPEVDGLFYWFLKVIVLGPILKTLFRPWVKGLEHVPETGGAIFASNHLSFSDSVFLPLMVPRRITFLAKADYFTGRGVKGRTTAAFFKGIGQLPVDRSGGKAGEAALRTGLRVLRRGDCLGIYPEGTRSPDGRLYRGKTGVARMALEGKVPVVPVVMIGTREVQPIGKKVPNIKRVGIVIGKPLDFSRYEGMEGDRFVLRSITDEIMYEVMKLSGQEYADVYASSVKAGLTAAAVKERFEALAARGREVLHPEQRDDESTAAKKAHADHAAEAEPAGADEPPAVGDDDPAATAAPAESEPDDRPNSAAAS